MIQWGKPWKNLMYLWFTGDHIDAIFAALDVLGGGEGPDA
jgi:hypothetical protein